MQLVIDVCRLRHNIRIIRAKTKTRFCAVVKSDAYGHGAVVSKYIEPLCDSFLVATSEEAFELSYMGIRKPIYIVGGDIRPMPSMRRCDNLVPSVSDVRTLDTLLKSGYNNFQIAVNTGMNRLGANVDMMEKIASYCAMNNVKPFGVYSHIYGGISSSAAQSAEFDRLTESPIFRGNRHLYCSVALDLTFANLYDEVRCGIAMYGYAKDLSPCMKARARIVKISDVPRGSHVGYGDFILDRDRRVATVRCGYADGFRRCDRPLYMKVRGVKCPVLGTPCMDLTMIDVTDVMCREGEFAYVISDAEDAEYLAKCYGTIVYEVLTGFNGRAERFYIR